LSSLESIRLTGNELAASILGEKTNKTKDAKPFLKVVSRKVALLIINKNRFFQIQRYDVNEENMSKQPLKISLHQKR
jgi:hypothetical protein